MRTTVNTTHRPQWNDPAVQSAAVKAYIEDAIIWASTHTSIDLSTEDAQRQFTAVIALAVQESADSFGAGRYLYNFMEWPVDRLLIQILDKMYLAMPIHASSAVHEWVMRERVRIAAKVGDFVRFKVGPVEMQGTVAALIAREARVIVEVRTSHNAFSNVSVNAEEILSHTKGTKRPPGGVVPPTGGTPVAPRAGAILKEAKAA